MVSMVRGTKRALIVGFIVLVGVMGNNAMSASAQGPEGDTPSSCPKPYIKLIKPNVAASGEQIVIRGHRFGTQGKASEVIFSPGIAGRVISWSQSRITVEVPPGAMTGAVEVKTECASSNGEFFKVR